MAEVLSLPQFPHVDDCVYDAKHAKLLRTRVRIFVDIFPRNAAFAEIESLLMLMVNEEQRDVRALHVGKLQMYCLDGVPLTMEENCYLTQAGWIFRLQQLLKDLLKFTMA